MYVINDKK
ncbi:hypothetical protein CARUB_v100079371mg, partial [Capsella rubella]